MKTLAERYCERYRCPPAKFRWQVFWRVVHRRAIPLLPFLLLTGVLDRDFELITACGRARSMRQVNEELEDFRYTGCRRGFAWRLKLRVSTRRLASLAAICFSPLPDPVLAAEGGQPSAC